MQCAFCDFQQPESITDCCPRCGACPDDSQLDSQLRRCLARLQRLLGHHQWIGRVGEKEIARVCTQIRALLDESPQLGERNRICLEQTGHSLRRLSHYHDLLRKIRLLRKCLPALIEPQKSEWEHRIELLDELRLRLDKTEQSFAGKKPPEAETVRTRLRVWLKQNAETAGETSASLADSLMGNSARWPETCRSLAPEKFRSREDVRAIDHALAALAEKDLDQAAALLKPVLARQPDHVTALELRATIFVRLDDNSSAIDCLRRAVRAGTRNGNTFNNLAWYLVTASTPGPEQFREALQLAQIAVELIPSATCLDTLAEIYMQLGDLPSAFAANRRGLQDTREYESLSERMEKLKELWSKRYPSSVERTDADPGLIEEEDFEMASLDDDNDGESSVLLFDDEDDADEMAPTLMPSVESFDLEEDFDEDLDDDFALMADEDEFSDKGGTLAPAPAIEPPPTEKKRPTLWGRLFGGGSTEASPETDQVEFTVTSPTVLAPARYYIIEVWAHLAELRNEVLESARQTVGGEPSAARKSGIEVERSAQITVQLTIPGLNIPDPTASMIWNGKMANCGFHVGVPDSAETRSHPGKAIISISQVRVAVIPFVVEVGATEVLSPTTSQPGSTHGSAFASYASADRESVAARLQGISKARPEMSIFFDVATLRSGQRWQNELTRAIDEADVFYLFWSKAASESEWVEREWRYAVEQKGVDFIDPVPLESPQSIRPPVELADQLHFNDWLLAFARPY